MSGEPIWLGPEDRPLAGWLHLPESKHARAGIVLCPTYGIEALVAQPAYRLLAIKLEQAGFAVLRFDYLATGDSFGSLEDDASVDAWLGSVAEATALLRACGIVQVGLVGLRFGGTMAAIAAARGGDIDSLVLWDPCASGRAFLREQQALEALSLGTPPMSDESGAVDLVAFRLPGKLAQEIKALRLDLAESSYDNRTLLVERWDRPRNAQVERWLASSQVDRTEAHGQSDFIDVAPGLSRIPFQTIGEIATWLCDTSPEDVVPIQSVERTCAIVARDKVGQPIVEHALSFGSTKLFGIITEPVVAINAPAVIFLNVGLLPHVGPGRYWVDLAREWARDGLRILRFDLSGIGESPAHEGCRPHVSQPRNAVADIAEAMSVISPDDPSRVVLVGICSGAYHAIEAGIALNVQGVALINPILYFDPPEITANEDLATNRVAVQPVHGIVRRMRNNRAVVRVANISLVRRIRHSELLARLIDDCMPRVVWQLLDWTGWFRSGARCLEALAAKGTRTLLICGKPESRIFRRSIGRLRALAQGGSFRFVELDELDHSVFSEWSRCAMAQILREYIPAEFKQSETSAVEPTEAANCQDQFVSIPEESIPQETCARDDCLMMNSNSQSASKVGR